MITILLAVIVLILLYQAGARKVVEFVLAGIACVIAFGIAGIILFVLVALKGTH